MMKHTLLAQQSIGTFKPPTDAFSLNSEISGEAATSNFEHFISNAIAALTIIGGLFFIFYFVMGGLNWITAGGEQGKITKARDQMVQGVVGMIVIIISYGLIGVVGALVGFDFLHPGFTFLQLRP